MVLKKKNIILISLGTLALLCMHLFVFNKSDPKIFAQELLNKADIQINGTRPWDIKVNNEALYARVMSQGSLGFGEAYMDGWWDVQSLDQFFDKVMSADLHQEIKFNLTTLSHLVKARFINLQSPARSFEIGEQHYDLDYALFENTLDSRLMYTCGYWNKAQSLDEAQEHKIDLVCRKLNLKPGMQVLDIGCGWGGFAHYAASKYGVQVTGITISKEQKKYADTMCQGLPVSIIMQDYRDLNQKFDRIVSMGMFEQVGYKNYKDFMRVAHQSLKDDGLMLLHSIGGNFSNTTSDPWILKYIFPNSMLPSASQIADAYQGLFVMEDWHNFGTDYDKTLMAWFEKFDKNWPVLQSKFDDRFYRMWKYYLLMCAGLFRARKTQLWQIVLSKNGIPGGYSSIR